MATNFASQPTNLLTCVPFCRLWQFLQILHALPHGLQVFVTLAIFFLDLLVEPGELVVVSVVGGLLPYIIHIYDQNSMQLRNVIRAGLIMTPSSGAYPQFLEQ